MAFITYTKDYSKFHRVVFEGVEYIFDPYQNGIGMWKEYTASGKAGKIVTKNIQLKLNEKVFGNADLPNMVERYKMATFSEKQILTDVAISWLQLKIKGIKSGTEFNIENTTNTFMMGRMYFYIYDAKWKNILPVWDRYPLMIPIKTYSNGVLGLNLHYLDSGRRAVILNILEKEYGAYTEKELKLNIDYDDISRLSGIVSRSERSSTNQQIEKLAEMPELKDCVKRYLTPHIRSKLLIIEPHEWAYAIWLPIDEFVYLNRTIKKGFI